MRRIFVLLLVATCAAFWVGSASSSKPSVQAAVAQNTTMMGTSVDVTIYCRGLQPGESVQMFTQFTATGDDYSYWLGTSAQQANAGGIVVFRIPLDLIKNGDYEGGTVIATIYDARPSGYGLPVTLSDGSQAVQTFQVP